jgi:hypothetical protein
MTAATEKCTPMSIAAITIVDMIGMTGTIATIASASVITGT